MNDGIRTLILEWSLLWLLWMGILDRQLRGIHLTRTQALAVVSLYLLGSFTDWKLSFPPVAITVSGTILPLLTAAWIWTGLSGYKRGCSLAAAVFTVFALFAARKLLFWDPVLLLIDETLLLPLYLLALLFLLTRDWREQLFIVLIGLPLADALYMLSCLPQLKECVIGGGYAQDLLWTALPLWMAAAAVWAVLYRGIVSLRAVILPWGRWRTKTNAHR
ncbi:hypothetical protein G3578_05285 [Brevibacillus sp. SYP-B805]|uniref:YphA family membrane protein n=1 Tax=Brevibacillus sp. SYP-B805 TaxID=1578199 RepID=UPI0013E9A658|nr:hypothetical protein [Brevibacillus sp. SYP-B805]NGQ94593.1 hypothetical protein [Brevibacillus sp. SYP-B805]